MPTDHYATLGLDRAASADEIKLAFRRRASAAHPDRGGSADEMAAVNAAYEVLGDPERRARYDAGGDGSSLDAMEEEARGMLMTAFSQAIDAGEGRFLVSAAEYFRNLREIGTAELQGLDVQEKDLRRRREAFSTADGAPNMAHVLIDSKLAAAAASRAQIDRTLKLLEIAQRMLDQHRCSEQARPAPPRQDIFGRRSSAIFTDGV